MVLYESFPHTLKRVLRQVYGPRAWMRLKLSPKGRERTLEIESWCLNNSVPLSRFLTVAFSLFDQDWCLKTFRKRFPPLGVILSEKTFQRVTTLLAGPKKLSDSDVIWMEQEAERSLKCLTKPQALEIIQGGWPPWLPPEGRERLKEKVSLWAE